MPFAIKACIIQLFVRDFIGSKSVICNKVMVAQRGCCLHPGLGMPLPSASRCATRCPGVRCGRARRRCPLFLHPDQCSEVKASVGFLVVRGALWAPDLLLWHSWTGWSGNWIDVRSGGKNLCNWGSRVRDTNVTPGATRELGRGSHGLGEF